MGFLINKEKFADIEDSFVRLKANNSDAAALSKMSSAISALTGKSIVVDTVSPTSKNQSCFVMSVYPSESDIAKIVEAIVTEQSDGVLAKLWADAASWNIEVDTRILNDADLNEKELTSLLLHEVGHIVYSNSVPMKIAKIIRYEYAKTPMVQKQLLKNTFFSKLILFPILYVCQADNNKKAMKEEMKADKYSINSGYGEELASAIDKIIAYAGSDDIKDKGVEELMGFSIDSLVQLQNRQNNIVRRNVGKIIAGTPSKIAKKFLDALMTGLNGNPDSLIVTESRQDDWIASQIDKITENYYTEAFLFGPKKMKKIDPADIDYIAINIDSIRTNDDRMMLVSYIYNKMETIDYYISLIDSKNPKYVIPHSRESLVQMKDRLEKYRTMVLSRRLPDVSYGISIQYPEGYEG